MHTKHVEFRRVVKNLKLTQLLQVKIIKSIHKNQSHSSLGHEKLYSIGMTDPTSVNLLLSYEKVFYLPGTDAFLLDMKVSKWRTKSEHKKHKTKEKTRTTKLS